MNLVGNQIAVVVNIVSPFYLHCYMSKLEMNSSLMKLS